MKDETLVQKTPEAEPQITIKKVESLTETETSALQTDEKMEEDDVINIPESPELGDGANEVHDVSDDNDESQKSIEELSNENSAEEDKLNDTSAKETLAIATEAEDDDDVIEISEGSSDERDTKDTDNLEKEDDDGDVKEVSKSSDELDDKDDSGKEEDDVIEIFEADPLAGEGEEEEDEEVDKLEGMNLSSILKNSALTISEVNSSKGSSNSTIVVNNTQSLANLATNSNSQEPKKEPTLVIIDTNSILSGRGPVPVQKSGGSGSPLLSNQIRSSPQNLNSYEIMSKPSTLRIPDDAFLIEAPSFIVPYVFEQAGKSSMKTKLKELDEAVKKEKQEKAEANGETYVHPVPEKKKISEDYFDSPVGKLLQNVGMNLVQEFVQVDLLKMQKRKAEKEKSKSRIGFVPMQTQQSIISLKNNIEESKENNEPFRHRMKKCELCNFKTESALVMSAHLETPHMRNYSYRCNFCSFTTREPHAILYHMESEHSVKPRLERAPAYHQCPNCPFEDNSKAKLTRHLLGCVKRFKLEKNLDPPMDWDTPAKLPKLPKSRIMPQGGVTSMNQYMTAATASSQQQQRTIIAYSNMAKSFMQQQQQQPGKMSLLPPLMQAPKKQVPGMLRQVPKLVSNSQLPAQLQRAGMMMRTPVQMAGQIISQSHLQLANNQILQQVISGQLAAGSNTTSSGGGFLSKLGLGSSSLGNGTQQNSASSSQSGRGLSIKASAQPSISITPLPRQTPTTTPSVQAKPQAKTSFVICEICDGYIKDLDQLRNHMQWIHKVKIHPKMIYNKPPLNCQKCQFRFFTDQGLERHLLGSHGLVTSSMQDAANKGQDNGRCPLCGKVYQWKLLAHVAKDHNVTLKPAHLSYKCTVCTATFGMYKLFESHVYSAHSMNAKKTDRRPQPASTINSIGRGSQMQVTSRPISAASQNSFRPMKINDEITIIPQPMANNSPLRSKGSLTITPQSSTRRNVRSNEDEGIQIIEIDDAPQKGPSTSNGRNSKENGEFLGRLPISDSILRKRNLEISVCGTDSDNNSSADESFQREPAMKRTRQN